MPYRIALGRHAGKKAFTLQALPAEAPRTDDVLATVAGFSLHAGVWVGANDRAKLERICRYIARPAVSNERIELTECGHVRYTLKTPYRDGATARGRLPCRSGKRFRAQTRWIEVLIRVDAKRSGFRLME